MICDVFLMCTGIINPATADKHRKVSSRTEYHVGLNAK